MIERGMRESRLRLEQLGGRGGGVDTTDVTATSPASEEKSRRTMSLSEVAALGRAAYATLASQDRINRAVADGTVMGTRGTQVLDSDDDDEEEEESDDEVDAPVDLSCFVDMVIPKYFDDGKYYDVRAK